MDRDKFEIISGALFADDRGVLRFVNEFSFEGIKRFYQVENFNLDTVRAFHGHLKEAKYVYVVHGSIILCAVPINDTQAPSKNSKVERVILSDKRPQIAYIPPSYANGFKCLEPNTKIIFFSTSTLEEPKGDDYRFPHDYWGSHLWNIEHR